MSKVVSLFPVGQGSEAPCGQLAYSVADLVGSAMDTSQPLKLAASLVHEIGAQADPRIDQTESDWSNQELASLYRAQRLLSLTGVEFEVDRGLSDEGDPWFVFLDDNDYLFAHFCRIGGIYHLDSAAQTEVLTAPSLEELVGSFARRKQVLDVSSGRAGTAGLRVIEPFASQQTKVLMHPGISLAALIWSIYAASESLVLPTWEQEVDVADGAAMPKTANVALSIAETDELPAGADSPYMQHHSVQEAVEREVTTNGQSASFSYGNAHAMNVIALGLTSIAMSYGIYTWIAPSLAGNGVSEDTENEAMLLASADLPGEVYADLEALSGDLLGVIEDLPRFADRVESADGEVLANIELVSDFADLVMVAFDKIAFVLADLKEANPQLAAHTDQPEGLSEVESVIVAENVENPLEVLASTSHEIAFTKQFVLEQIASFDVVDLANLNVLANNNLLSEEEGKVVASILPVDLFATDGTRPEAETEAAITYDLFDKAAHDFIVYLMLKEENPQRSSHDGEIILIDTTAFEGSEGGVYARSWSFDDGSIISTVGLKSDFEAFGLVA